MGVKKHDDTDSTKGLSAQEKKTDGANRRGRGVAFKIWESKQKANKDDGKGTH